jgi:hypothetical protein
MPVKGKAPLTPLQKKIFKKTTSVNGRLSLGVARDAKTGRLVKIDKLNKFEKERAYVHRVNKYGAWEFPASAEPIERYVSNLKPTEKRQISDPVLQKRNYLRIERQNVEMVKRINRILNLGELVSYSMDDVIKNAYRTFIKVASARRGEPISKVNTREYFNKFKERFIRNLRNEYIKTVGKNKTYDIDYGDCMLILQNATRAEFKDRNLGEEFLESDYIHKNILRKAKRI